MVDNNEEEFFLDDPHAIDNELSVEVEGESVRWGQYTRSGGILHFSDMSGRYGGAPYPGEHTRAIMEEVGYSEEQIEDYRERGIFHWEEANPIFPG